jgi:hypothetical protein
MAGGKTFLMVWTLLSSISSFVAEGSDRLVPEATEPFFDLLKPSELETNFRHEVSRSLMRGRAECAARRENDAMSLSASGLRMYGEG